MSRGVAYLPDSKFHPARNTDRAANPVAAQPESQTRHDTYARHETGAPLNYVVGPNGDILTLADLPSPQTRRWVIRRKAEVVLAVHGGLLSLDDACRRYQLTAEEFFAWQNAIERHGLLGLRSTHLQDYRHGDKR